MTTVTERSEIRRWIVVPHTEEDHADPKFFQSARVGTIYVFQGVHFAVIKKDDSARTTTTARVIEDRQVKIMIDLLKECRRGLPLEIDSKIGQILRELGET